MAQLVIELVVAEGGFFLMANDLFLPLQVGLPWSKQGAKLARPRGVDTSDALRLTSIVSIRVRTVLSSHSLRNQAPCTPSVDLRSYGVKTACNDNFCRS
jgi:hypothetical protein